MTPREARAIAKVMFRELAKIPPRLPSHQDNPEFFERAAVLADVVLQSGRPDVMGESVALGVGEALALAVRGRVTPYSNRFIHMGIGAQLPPATEATELANAIQWAEQILFPPRRRPCMPSRAELWELVRRAHGDDVRGRRVMRELWRHLSETCGYSSYSLGHLEHRMSEANDAIGGFGVERAAYELDTQRGMERPIDFYYVNTGDTYNATLIGDVRRRRFYISTWGDEVERAERRFGEGGMWRV